MRLHDGCRRWTAWLVICGTAGEAHAAGSPPPRPITPYVDRGTLYEPGQAGVNLDVRAEAGPTHPGAVETTLGMGLGVTRWLSLDGSLGTMAITPSVRYRHPELGLWVGLLDTPPLEIDATAYVTFGTEGEGVVHELDPALSGIVRTGGLVRIDVGVHAPMSRDETVDLGLRVPVALAVQLNPYLHAAMSSGVAVPKLAVGRAVVPLGVSLGCTVPLGGGGYAVVEPSVKWPRLVGGDGDAAGRVEVGVSVSVVTPP